MTGFWELMNTDVNPVVLVSDGTYGGAAIACSRLRRGLLGLGENVQWISLNGVQTREVTVVATWPPLMPLLTHRIVMAITRSESCRRWACDQVGNAAMLACVGKIRPRLINLHGIHEGMTFRLAERLPRQLPLVWTLHDMWPITGYCCHSMECDKYATGCFGDCPQMGAWGKALRSPEHEWRRRNAFFRSTQKRLILVSPSQWLAGCARRRVPGNVRVEHIPNGIDLNIFRPLSSQECAKQVLGLPTDQPVILGGACSLSDKLKGASILVAALSRLRAAGVRFTFVTFGDAATPLMEGEHRLGVVRDEAALNLCYNAADIFVHPSLADNLPNVLIESLAAGTPCVTTHVGGCPEIITDGRTGLVAKAQNIENLAYCIHEILASPQSVQRAMRTECREVAERNYSLELMASRYDKLFQLMVERG